jgi:hypothetical protein
MSELVQLKLGLGQGLARLRWLAAWLAEWREMSEPLTEREGLRRTIELVIELGAQFGVEEAWLERLRTVLVNEQVFGIVLAIVRFVVDRLDGNDERLSAQAEVTVETAALVEWLPLVLELLQVVWRLRGKR